MGGGKEYNFAESRSVFLLYLIDRKRAKFALRDHGLARQAEIHRAKRWLKLLRDLRCPKARRQERQTQIMKMRALAEKKYSLTPAQQQRERLAQPYMNEPNHHDQLDPLCAYGVDILEIGFDQIKGLCDSPWSKQRRRAPLSKFAHPARKWTQDDILCAMAVFLGRREAKRSKCKDVSVTMKKAVRKSKFAHELLQSAIAGKPRPLRDVQRLDQLARARLKEYFEIHVKNRV